MYLRYLDSRIQQGSLYFHLPNGELHTFGDGGPQVDWFIHRRNLPQRLLRRPGTALGESYVRGEWDVGPGQLTALLSMLLQTSPAPSARLAALFRLPWGRLPKLPRHADLGDWFFKQFLDQDLHYDSGYFEDPNVSLEQAQRAKCRRLATKLQLQPGQHLLDLNTQWGGAALHFAEHHQVRVTGLTRSKEQQHFADNAARDRRLKRQAHFRLAAPGECNGPFDSILVTSVPGCDPERGLAATLRETAALLKTNGTAVLRVAAGLRDSPRINPWLRRHLVPRGACPALPEVITMIGKAGLCVTDVEVQQQHVGYTLAAWQHRFRCNRAAIAHRFGERFTRLWEFYLAALEATFANRPVAMTEIQLAHTPAAVPATRAYLDDRSEPVPADTPTGLGALGDVLRSTERDHRR